MVDFFSSENTIVILNQNVDCPIRNFIIYALQLKRVVYVWVIIYQRKFICYNILFVYIATERVMNKLYEIPQSKYL